MRILGPVKTLGQRLLKEWLDADKSRTQQGLADLLGIRQSSVSLWVSGHTRPEPPHRTALKAICEIEEDAWLTAAERRGVERLRNKLAARADGG